MLRWLGKRLLLTAGILATALLVGRGASADVIVYQIGSSGVLGEEPFSGLLAHCGNPDHDHSDDDDRDRDHEEDDRDRHRGDDDDDDRKGGKHWRSQGDRGESWGRKHRGKDRDDGKHWSRAVSHHGERDEDDDRDDGGKRDDDDGGKFDKEDLKILSGDLSGLIALSSQDPLLFLEGQELVVEEFSLGGSARFCPGCDEVAISIDLDSRFDSILRVEEGSLEGEIRLILSLDGVEERELRLRARGETLDPEWNTASPEFLSLMLELDVSDEFLRKELDDDEHGYRDDDDDDDDDDDRDRHKGCSGDCRIFLKAQGPVVPEPGTALLLGAGLGLMALSRRR